MHELEAFFTRQMDMVWAWGLFRRLAPSSEERLSGPLLLKLLGYVVLLAFLLIVSVFMLAAFTDVVTSGPLAPRHLLLSFLHTLQSIFGAIGSRTLFLVIFVSYGLILIALPYIFFWNRRAERRHREGNAAPVPPVAAPEVWPPPPNVPKPR